MIANDNKKLIGKDGDLISAFQPDFSLISASITCIQVSSVDLIAEITIQFDLLYPKGVKLLIRFSNVKEFSFYHNETFNFYQIHSVKAFVTDKGYYFCFDPVSETNEIEELDNDFILCGSVEGYELVRSF